MKKAVLTKILMAFGSRGAMAAIAKIYNPTISHQSVQYWFSSGVVPANRVIRLIEVAKQRDPSFDVTPYQIRPDVFPADRDAA